MKRILNLKIKVYLILYSILSCGAIAHAGINAREAFDKTYHYECGPETTQINMDQATELASLVGQNLIDLDSVIKTFHKSCNYSYAKQMGFDVINRVTNFNTFMSSFHYECGPETTKITLEQSVEIAKLDASGSADFTSFLKAFYKICSYPVAKQIGIEVKKGNFKYDVFEKSFQYECGPETTRITLDQARELAQFSAKNMADADSVISAFHKTCNYANALKISKLSGQAINTKSVSFVSLQSLPQNLTELSKVIYDNPTDAKAWSRARLVQELGQDLTKDEYQSKKLNSNILLLFAVNGFVSQLTSKDVEQNFKPKYIEAMETMKKQDWTSIEQVDLDLSSLNMAISITEKSLQTILVSSSVTAAEANKIRSFISKMARDVSTQAGQLRRGMAFAQFSEELVASGIINAALENLRTLPEGTMLNLVMGWITKK